MPDADIYIPTYLYVKQHKITKLKYFGKTIRKDPVKYLGSGTYWTNHINKHGKEYVETIWCQLFENKEELVEYALSFSEENDIVNSKEWANLMPENGLNGTMSGASFSEEHRKNMSISHKGKGTGTTNNACKPEVGARISAALKGIPKSQEHKEKLAEYKGEKHHGYGKPSWNTGLECPQISAALKGKPNGWLGKTHSEETKKIMSDSHSGVIPSAESNERRSATLKNKPKVICPYCLKEISSLCCDRWHFDNCKMRNKRIF